MRTLIAIIESTPQEANVAQAVSKATGYPILDINKYRAKTHGQGSPEAVDRAAWDLLRQDLRKTNIAIIDNMLPTEEAIKAFEGFDQRVIVFTKSELNKQTLSNLVTLKSFKTLPTVNKLTPSKASDRAWLMMQLYNDHRRYSTYAINTWDGFIEVEANPAYIRNLQNLIKIDGHHF